jgi:excisionase family DNA binding protein
MLDGEDVFLCTLMPVMPMTAAIKPIFGQPIYTSAEVANALRVSEESVRREIRRGTLSAARIGNQSRLTANDLAGWLGESRYRELFSPLGPLSALIGFGGLEDDEAHKLVAKAVSEVRKATPRSASGVTAPSPADVKARHQRQRQLDGRE